MNIQIEFINKYQNIKQKLTRLDRIASEKIINCFNKSSLEDISELLTILEAAKINYSYSASNSLITILPGGDFNLDNFSAVVCVATINEHESCVERICFYRCLAKIFA